MRISLIAILMRIERTRARPHTKNAMRIHLTTPILVTIFAELALSV